MINYFLISLTLKRTSRTASANATLPHATHYNASVYRVAPKK